MAREPVRVLRNDIDTVVVSLQPWPWRVSPPLLSGLILCAVFYVTTLLVGPAYFAWVEAVTPILGGVALALCICWLLLVVSRHRRQLVSVTASAVKIGDQVIEAVDLRGWRVEKRTLVFSTANLPVQTVELEDAGASLRVLESALERLHQSGAVLDTELSARLEARDQFPQLCGESGRVPAQSALLRQTVEGFLELVAPPPTDPSEWNPAAVIGLERGRKLFKEGRYTASVDAFRHALDLDPRYAEAALRMGMALEDNGEFDRAILAYEDCLATDPSYHQAATNMGEALRKGGRYQAAIEAYDRANRLDVNQYISAGRAECMRMLGQYEECLEWFDHALEVDGSHAFAIQGKAAALNELGRFERAEPLWLRALELEPQSDFVREGLTRCQVGLRAD